MITGDHTKVREFRSRRILDFHLRFHVSFIRLHLYSKRLFEIFKRGCNFLKTIRTVYYKISVTDFFFYIKMRMSIFTTLKKL